MSRDASVNTLLSEARDVASQVFVLCFPLMLTDTIRRAHPIAPMQLALLPHDAARLAPGLAEDDDRIVMTSAWIDLEGGPVILRLPNTRGRYFSVTLIDSAGDPFASLGSRTRDDIGVDLALAGPRWRGEVPDRLTARRAPSDGVWAVSRLHAHSAADRAEAEAVARRQAVVFLQHQRGHHDSRHPDSEAPEVASPRLEAPTSSIQRVADMTPTFFRHRLTTLFSRAPMAYQTEVHPLVEDLWNRLGQKADVSDLSADFERALARGFADGVAAIQAAAEIETADETSEWRTAGRSLDDEPGGALARAARAFAQIGGPVREDVLSLTCVRDEAGRALSGAECYRIHFPADAMPPVDAFWWLSAGSAARAGHHGLGDRSDLALNPDGSLDVIVQRDAPEFNQAANWLPSPAGEFALHASLYWPRRPALAGAWRMPPVERLGSTFGSNTGRRPRSGEPQSRPFRGRHAGWTRAVLFAWKTAP